MGTKSGDGHASPRSPDTTTSLKADGETQHIRTHVPPFNAVHGEKPWRGMAAAVKTPPGIRFSSTIKVSADGVETPEEDTRRIVDQRDSQGPVSSKRGQQQQVGESKRREHWAAVGAGIYPSLVAPSRVS
jgi:hypothetical protein